MDLELTEEQTVFRDRVRDLADREIRPAADACEPRSSFPNRLLPSLARMGLMGIAVPREYGGMGLDTVSACLAIRELARACPSTAVTVHVNNFVFCAPLLCHGTEEQKWEFLTPAAAGERLGAFALTEPDAGSDPSRISTLAVAQAEGFRVTGRKAWVTNGLLSSTYLVVARVERDGSTDHTAIFIVDAATPGLRIGPAEATLGLRSALVIHLDLDQCVLPESMVLGNGTDGLKLALNALQASRIGVAAQSVGIARGAMEQMAGGEGVSAAAARVEAANLLMLRAAWLVDRGISCPREASMAKLFCSETAVLVSAALLEQAGAEACLEAHPASRFWRDARVTTIYGGPSEIQRGLIGRLICR